MSQFKYILPSGAEFTMQAPTGTTQSQADYTFYSQVAAGSVAGLVPGQSISGSEDALVKFELSRLDRKTAGVDDVVISAIINGLPTVSTIPPLINTPLTNPVTQANIAAISGLGFTAPAIGTLTSDQTLALMATVVNSVDQSANVMTNNTGVGQYGLSCQQLEMAGYVKPGTWQQFLQDGSSTLTDVLNAPGIWTGCDGINTADEFLQNADAQNNAQATLMTDGYNSLQAVGVITTPAEQTVSAVVGTVYTGTPLTTATATVTDSVNSRVAALVTNTSVYGTAPTAQWANTNNDGRQTNSNLVGIVGIGVGLISQIPNLGSLFSGQTSSLPSIKTAMDTLGKASQFAATAASTLKSDITSNFNIGNITSNLTGQVTTLAGQIQGQATTLIDTAQAQVAQAQAQAKAVIAQAQGQFAAVKAQGDKLVASVEQAAGFANTVDRATIDVATTKIFGSAKIPTPSFGSDLPTSSSIAAALDITAAQDKLKELQGQGTALLNQGTTVINQATGTVTQVQNQANNLLASARNATTRIV
jgi:hypothetical protein